MKNTSKLVKAGAALIGLISLTTLSGACGSSSSDGSGGSTGTPSGGAGATDSVSASAGAAAAGTDAAGSPASAGGSSNASSSACGPKCAEASTCTPAVIPSGLTSLTDFASCTAAGIAVTNISTTPQTVKLLLADLTGGAPVSAADKKEVTGIGIAPTVDWTGKASPYALDLVIDDLTLIP